MLHASKQTGQPKLTRLLLQITSVIARRHRLRGQVAMRRYFRPRRGWVPSIEPRRMRENRASFREMGMPPHIRGHECERPWTTYRARTSWRYAQCRQASLSFCATLVSPYTRKRAPEQSIGLRAIHQFCRNRAELTPPAAPRPDSDGHGCIKPRA